ncbi:Predicted N-acetyltransferase YhbS [Arsukibacterium tuosuense]|uniref:Predicted N-acetyltransferase YhbS n=1 Tax=Arsukibacterium tuosuense TaxID=1323745 RepID=A0A285I0G2_9GAMM|nr:GNAT family N-acetyltransferase [Arsukibacterium tuosuense]SNY41438.1 Predicted N-acetyltransferase YhbS [Arsukibacterium tuosuense]
MKSIAKMQPAHFADVMQLANRVHGDNYLDLAKLTGLYQRGIKHGINASFVALSESRVVGYRLSFAAGQWPQDEWCTVKLWPVTPEKMAYFKSVAVAPELQGQGLGSALLKVSVSALCQQGATAGLAHIWRESPGNAAQRYFSKAGAKLITIHPDRWLHLCKTEGYVCPICGSECHCTAAEMALTFAGNC